MPRTVRHVTTSLDVARTVAHLGSLRETASIGGRHGLGMQKTGLPVEYRVALGCVASRCSATIAAIPLVRCFRAALALVILRENRPSDRRLSSVVILERQVGTA